MKLNRNSLRKMILNEIRNLQEGRYTSSGPNLSQLFGHLWGRRFDWNFVTNASIQSAMKMSGMDAMTFFETVKAVGHEWQLKKVAEALSEVDTNFYDYAKRELGTQLFHDTPGSKIRLPKLTKSTSPLADDEFDFDDDDDDVYPGPLVP
jgi:hypothetical protein